jgi:beta-lactamase superfamily II metal-dependent hydrolase
LLWHNWITSLDRLILSHTDTDHAGGVPAVMKNFGISRFNYSAAYTDSVLDRIMDIARKRNLGRVTWNVKWYFRSRRYSGDAMPTANQIMQACRT